MTENIGASWEESLENLRKERAKKTKQALEQAQQSSIEQFDNAFDDALSATNQDDTSPQFTTKTSDITFLQKVPTEESPHNNYQDADSTELSIQLSEFQTEKSNSTRSETNLEKTVQEKIAVINMELAHTKEKLIAESSDEDSQFIIEHEEPLEISGDSNTQKGESIFYTYDKFDDTPDTIDLGTAEFVPITDDDETLSLDENSTKESPTDKIISPEPIDNFSIENSLSIDSPKEVSIDDKAQKIDKPFSFDEEAISFTIEEPALTLEEPPILPHDKQGIDEPVYVAEKDIPTDIAIQKEFDADIVAIDNEKAQDEEDKPFVNPSIFSIPIFSIEREGEQPNERKVLRSSNLSIENHAESEQIIDENPINQENVSVPFEWTSSESSSDQETTSEITPNESVNSEKETPPINKNTSSEYTDSLISNDLATVFTIEESPNFQSPEKAYSQNERQDDEPLEVDSSYLFPEFIPKNTTDTHKIDSINEELPGEIEEKITSVVLTTEQLPEVPSEVSPELSEEQLDKLITYIAPRIQETLLANFAEQLSKTLPGMIIEALKTK